MQMNTWTISIKACGFIGDMRYLCQYADDGLDDLTFKHVVSISASVISPVVDCLSASVVVTICGFG